MLQILPSGWDFQRDLLVVVGAKGKEVVDSYRLVGQERIAVVLAPGSLIPEGLPSSVVVTNLEGVTSVAQSLGGGVVQHAWIVQTTDECVTADFVMNVRLRLKAAMRVRAMNHGTLRKFGRDWLMQSIANLPTVAGNPSVAHLVGAFRKRPAVIVSPGPSLSKQLPALAALDGRAVVISGSHAPVSYTHLTLPTKA